MAIPYQSFAKVHPTVFFAIQWIGLALALSLLFFRFIVRWRTSVRFGVDDCLLVVAFVCYLTNCILWHVELPKVYEMYAALAGKTPPEEIMATLAHAASLLRSIVAFNVLFVCCLWSVKFSFIAFFHNLGRGSQGKHYWLWFVLFITVGTFAGAIGDYDWDCSRGTDVQIISYCSSEKAKKPQATSFRVNTSFDILTDCLIMSIPMVMVWNLQLPLNKKLLLFSLFSLTLITMITALIRLLVVPKGMIGSDFTWSFTWSNIEMTISIVVACLGAFRQLYTSQERGRSSYPSSKQSRPTFVGSNAPVDSAMGPSESQRSLYNVDVVMPGGPREGETVPLRVLYSGDKFYRNHREVSV